MNQPDRGVSRRAFARSAVLAGAAGGLGRSAASAPLGEIKVGLYSITYLGVWYRGDALPLDQVIQRAKKYGYDGVEIDGKRPHGNPLDLPKARCQQLRKAAEDQGIEIYGVAANNDFSSPIPEFREAQMAYMRELLRMASDLKVKVVRVFFAWPGITRVPLPQGGGTYDISKSVWAETHKKFSPEQIWEWCRECFIESARYAGDFGVTLALQNHPPVCKDVQDVLRMVREVGSPDLKVCFDAGMEPNNKDAAHIRQATLEVGSLQMISHFGGEFDEGPKLLGEGPHLVQVKSLLEAGYHGYIGYELCHPLPVVNGQTVGIEYAEKCARLAAPFLRGIIGQAKKELGA